MSNFPKKWEVVTVADIADLINGDRGDAYPSKNDFIDHGIPFINAGDLNGKIIGNNFVNYISEEKYNDLRAGKVIKEDILYCLRGSLGKIGFYGNESPAAIASSLVIVRAKNFLNKNFIFNYLKSPIAYKEIKKYDNGSAQPNLASKSLGCFSFPLPPLQEQRRIADKIDTVLTRVDALNDRLTRITPLLKRFRQSVLAAAESGALLDVTSRSWPIVTLGELLENGPKNGLYKHQSAYGEGTRILRIDAFYDGRVSDWGALKKLTLEPDELEQFRLVNDDLVINRVNSIEYLGKCALIEGLSGDCVFESNMMRMRLNADLANPRFVRDWLCSDSAKSQIRLKAKHAVNQASINQGDVRGLELRLPTIQEQAEITSRVDMLFAYADRLEARLQTARTAADRLTPALLAKAFRGELVPQDPNDEPATELLRRLREARAAEVPVKKARGRKAAVT
ncbi:restriction endonuclease subunit S [Comamonas testosteroni]|uniref:restriction endonuclease subunit S n=1 Tax=Comamonas testosteroni TaxID=285 RepID=UPI0028EBFFEB|nr:restriction endonuclease subunit S [Comamonas testosteroni]